MFHVSYGFVLLSSTVAAQEPPNPNILQDNRMKPAETGSYLTAHTTTNSLFSRHFWNHPRPDGGARRAGLAMPLAPVLACGVLRAEAFAYRADAAQVLED
jgi:hypothetical protein